MLGAATRRRIRLPGDRRGALARRFGALVAALGAAGIVGLVAIPRSATAIQPALSQPAISQSLPPIKHVWVIVLENESPTASFGSGSPAPYLAQTLTSEGAYLPNYFGIGHESLANYIAMISGQPPNPSTQSGCPPQYTDVSPATLVSYGAAAGIGCVYPAAVQTIGSQLAGAGLTWKAYEEDMGNDPTRDGGTTCAHPTPGQTDLATPTSATAMDGYVTSHDPFVYFHSIIDQASCATSVVPLSALSGDLASASTTPNYSFITPNVCDDGGLPGGCPNGDTGGLAQANTFLQTWVPQILNSPAYQQSGLLLITFDESVDSDSGACCGEIPGPASALPGRGGPGGGTVGAVLLSPFIAPGTVSETDYNHYTMLGSIEDLFGLPHLGYAQLPDETDFGSDVYTSWSGSTTTTPTGTTTTTTTTTGTSTTPTTTGTTTTPSSTVLPAARITAPKLVSQTSANASVIVRWSATNGSGAGGTYRVQVRDLGVKNATTTTVDASTSRTSLSFRGTLGHTYEFTVAAVSATGQTGPPATSTVVFPSGAKPAKGAYSSHWKVIARKGAWNGHVIESSTRGATFALTYVGGSVSLIGERSPAGGKLTVTLDGHTEVVKLSSKKRELRQTLVTLSVRTGHKHHLRLTVDSGTVAIEGYGITSRTS
jgi:hypothetical protein